MRLKGGKLLLDLSKYVLSDEPEIKLTQEQVDCILSKGLSVKITPVYLPIAFVFDLHVITTNIDGNDSFIEFNHLTCNDLEDEAQTEIGFLLNLYSNELQIYIV